MSRELTAEQRAQLRAVKRMDVGIDEYTWLPTGKITPEGKYVLHSDYQALLDELERKEKEKTELKSYYEGVIADGSKRIAELEARSVTVKLPHQFKTSMYGTPLYEQCDILAMLADAGINLTVEG